MFSEMDVLLCFVKRRVDQTMAAENKFPYVLMK